MLCTFVDDVMFAHNRLGKGKPVGEGILGDSPGGSTGGVQCDAYNCFVEVKFLPAEANTVCNNLPSLSESLGHMWDWFKPGLSRYLWECCWYVSGHFDGWVLLLVLLSLTGMATAAQWQTLLVPVPGGWVDEWYHAMLDCKSKRSWVQIVAGERKKIKLVRLWWNYQMQFHCLIALVHINVLTALWQK